MTSVSKTSAYPVSVQPGIPRLQDCPDGWTIGPLSEFLYEARRSIKMADEDIYRLVKVKRARGGVVVRENLAGKNISVKSQSEIKTGDFLISKRQIVHGACGLVPSELEGSIVSNEYSVLRGNDDISLDYLNYLAHSVYFQQTCFHSSIGVHVEKMIFKLDRWLSWDFLIPPLAEQKRIAEILSTWDRAIEVVEGLIENSHAQKKALMQQLLTGKKRLPGFDGEWENVKLSDVSDMNSGGTPKSDVKGYYGGNIPWVSISDMTKRGKMIFDTKTKITNDGLLNSSARMYPINTVLYAMYASIGECSIAAVELCSSQAILGIRPKSMLNYEFLYFFLLSLKTKIALQGQQGTQANLNQKMVKDFKLRLPSLKEQTAIAVTISVADREVEILAQQLTQLKSEKSALMQQLLTGKRRVKITKEAANA